MLIAVGSLNAVKLETARRVFARTHPGARIEGVSVSSGVSSQPLTDDTSIKGALNRASRARAALDADFGVGFEGGALRTRYGFFMSAWCVVVDRKGNVGIGGGNNMLLPTSVARSVFDENIEISQAIKPLASLVDDPQARSSTDGILSNGLIDRCGSYEVILIYALGKFLSNAYQEDIIS